MRPSQRSTATPETRSPLTQSVINSFPPCLEDRLERDDDVPFCKGGRSESAMCLPLGDLLSPMAGSLICLSGGGGAIEGRSNPISEGRSNPISEGRSKPISEGRSNPISVQQLRWEASLQGHLGGRGMTARSRDCWLNDECTYCDIDCEQLGVSRNCACIARLIN